MRVTGDRVLSGLFGESSTAVVDLESLGSTHRWVGSPATLSARRVLTHLMTDDTSYDLATRVLSRAGAPLATPAGPAWQAPASPSRVAGTVLLGGGVLGSDVVGDVVAAARAVDSSKTARLVVLGGGSGSSSLVNAYAQAVRKAGWTGAVTTVVHGSKGWPGKDLSGATAVVLVGDDPVALASSMADPAFRDAVTSLVRTTPVVLADGTMTAVIGARWSAKARPTASTLGGRGHRGLPGRRRRVAGGARPGAGHAGAAPHRRLPLGSAHAGVTAAPQQLALGVAAGSAVVLAPSGASVSGASVVVADGREGSSWTGANGALGAGGVVLDVFGDGEALHR